MGQKRRQTRWDDLSTCWATESFDEDLWMGTVAVVVRWPLCLQLYL